MRFETRRAVSGRPNLAQQRAFLQSPSHLVHPPATATAAAGAWPRRTRPITNTCLARRVAPDPVAVATAVVVVTARPRAAERAEQGVAQLPELHLGALCRAPRVLAPLRRQMPHATVAHSSTFWLNVTHLS
jgi:hypothetical protein